MSMRSNAILGAALLVLVACPPAIGQVPHLINYQGMLTDVDDVPVNGSYQMVFRIYETATGGTPVWTEDHATVSVAQGLFHILLGSITPLDLAFDRDLYLGVQVGGDPEMTPRKRIVSVGTAYRAEEADNAATLDGKTSGDFATADHIHDDRYNTAAELRADDGSPPNSGSNTVHWNNLTGVPAGIADGVDNEGSGGTPISSVDGLSGGTITSDVTVDGTLVSGRHEIDVGDDNAFIGTAETDFTTVVADNLGAGTGIWGSATTGWGVVATASSSGHGLWSRSEEGRAGEFQTGDAASYAVLIFSAGELDENPGLFVRGTANITGGVVLPIQTSTGVLESSSMLAPEAQMTLSGHGQLVGGERFVAFADAMMPANTSVQSAPFSVSSSSMDAIAREIFAETQEIRIVITPTSECNGLFVAEKSASGFLVRELMKGNSNATFDWMAVGSLKKRQALGKPAQESAPNPPSVEATSVPGGGKGKVLRR